MKYMKQRKTLLALILLLIVGTIYISVIQESEEKYLLEFRNSSYDLNEPIDTIKIME